MKITLIKGLGALVAADDESKAVLDRMKRGQHVDCDIRRMRNPMFHRKFMALLRLTFANQDKYESFEAFRREVIIRCGYATTHVHVDGAVSVYADSIAFDKMDEDTFTDLYDGAVRTILKYFIHVDREDLEAEVANAILDLVA